MLTFTVPFKPIFSEYLTSYRKHIDALTQPVASHLIEMAEKATDDAKGLGSAAMPLPPPDAIELLEKEREHLLTYAKSIAPEDLRQQSESLRKSIASMSKSIGSIVTSVKIPDAHRVPDLNLEPTLPNLKPYFESSEEIQKALTPKPGRTGLSAQIAKAAVPKLVDFAEQLGNVTDVIISMKVKTATGATAEMQQEFKVQPTGTQPQMLESMVVTRSPEPTAFGPHVRRFVKEVDWEKRTIVFKGRSHNRITLPPDSDGAWNYMKRLLTSTAPQGWVELADDCDARWQGHFTRTDAHGNVDVKNPLTILLCHIESFRKRGRPSKKETENATSPNVPKIHLTAFQKARFDLLTKKQKAAQQETLDHERTSAGT